MTAREPMARRSIGGGGGSLWVSLAVAAVCLFGVWALAAHLYRQSHCVYLLGHWISLGQTTIPTFCQ